MRFWDLGATDPAATGEGSISSMAKCTSGFCEPTQLYAARMTASIASKSNSPSSPAPPEQWSLRSQRTRRQRRSLPFGTDDSTRASRRSQNACSRLPREPCESAADSGSAISCARTRDAAVASKTAKVKVRLMPFALLRAKFLCRISSLSPMPTPEGSNKQPLGEALSRCKIVTLADPHGHFATAPSLQL